MVGRLASPVNWVAGRTSHVVDSPRMEGILRAMVRQAQRASMRLTLGIALVAALSAASVVPAADEDQQPQEPEAEPTAPAPRLLIRGFGNIDFLRRDDDKPSTFSLGELDIFLTSELTPELSVLAEVVIEPEEGSHPVIEIERYAIRWAARDFFQLAFGRLHTPLGYWNQTFHHGAWFQTTIGRPLVYLWEHDGGVLPVHDVGLQLLGSIPVSGITLEYNAGVSNGRGHDPEEVQDLQDANASKAVNLWLGVVPHPLRSLKLGGVVRFDRIPGSPEDAAAGELDERIIGGFLAFTPRRAEVLAEVFRVEHEARDTGDVWRTTGLYVQGAVRFGRLKPYYRYDYLDVGDGDPFYAQSGTLSKHTLGARHDPWSWACAKLELYREHQQGGPSVGAVAFQVAFTF
jgi:hypothetical protein